MSKSTLESQVKKFRIKFQDTKIGWAIADVHAMCWWVLPKLLYTFISLCIIILYPEVLPFDVSPLRNHLFGNWSGVALMFLISLWPLVFAFIWVIVLRKNFTVKEAQRARPYTEWGF